MSDHGLLYLIGGMTILMLLISALTLFVVWLVHRDIDNASGLHSPAGWCETCRMRVPDLAEHLAHRHPGFDPPPDSGAARPGVALLGLTAVLVVAGCALYVAGLVGWAQLTWVLGSGTAGAGVMAYSDNH